jgi:hypothetical protein
MTYSHAVAVSNSSAWSPTPRQELRFSSPGAGIGYRVDRWLAAC